MTRCCSFRRTAIRMDPLRTEPAIALLVTPLSIPTILLSKFILEVFAIIKISGLVSQIDSILVILRGYWTTVYVICGIILITATKRLVIFNSWRHEPTNWRVVLSVKQFKIHRQQVFVFLSVVCLPVFLPMVIFLPMVAQSTGNTHQLVRMRLDTRLV